MKTEELIKTVRFKGMSAEEKIEAIRYLINQGLSAYSIALQFAVTPQLIYYWINKHKTIKEGKNG